MPVGALPVQVGSSARTASMGVTVSSREFSQQARRGCLHAVLNDVDRGLAFATQPPSYYEIHPSFDRTCRNFPRSHLGNTCHLCQQTGSDLSFGHGIDREHKRHTEPPQDGQIPNCVFVR